MPAYGQRRLTQCLQSEEGQRVASAKKHLIVFLLLLFPGSPLPASAIDTLPGDYTALPDGTQTLQSTFTYGTSNARFKNGDRVAGKQSLDTYSLQETYRLFVTCGGLTLSPTVIVAYGYSRPAYDSRPAGTARGFGDPVLAATVYLLNNPGKRTFFGISPYLIPPVGSYDKTTSLSLGQNRWRFGVNSGYIVPLADNVLLDVVADVLWYGRNSDYVKDSTLDQDMLFNAQTHFRYLVDVTTALTASYYYDVGGESKLNGVPQGDAKSQGRFRVGVMKYLTRSQRIRIDWGMDSNVNNGFRKNSQASMSYLVLW